MKIIKKLIKQYIICKHDDYIVIREIYCGLGMCGTYFMERRKCENCEREYYSDYYTVIEGERYYDKHRKGR